MISNSSPYHSVVSGLIKSSITKLFYDRYYDMNEAMNRWFHILEKMTKKLIHSHCMATDQLLTKATTTVKAIENQKNIKLCLAVSHKVMLRNILDDI